MAPHPALSFPCALSPSSGPPQVFIFGGKTGSMSEDEKQGVYSNEVAILDTGNQRWTYPEIAGNLPPPRADCAVEFDPKLSRLILFGGWQGEWFSDVHTLDVGSIVGPPYAISDVYPSLGPITGGTQIEVVGIDFFNAEVDAWPHTGPSPVAPTISHMSASHIHTSCLLIIPRFNTYLLLTHISETPAYCVHDNVDGPLPSSLRWWCASPAARASWTSRAPT